jgi:hypothetical protein
MTVSKKNKKPSKKDLPYDNDSFYENLHVSSADDCTGLIPTPPKSAGEADSYTQLMDIPKPRKKSGRGDTPSGR